MDIIIQLFRFLVFIASIADCWKYKFITKKINRLKTSKYVSKKFVKISIGYRVLLLIYSLIFLKDWVITYSCIIAIYTIVETFYAIYVHHPYGKKKNVSFIKYALNSLLPKKFRKRF